MATTTIQSLALGRLGEARGVLGPAYSRATNNQIRTAANIVVDPRGFTSRLRDCVICMEDRLGPDGSRMHAPRLAGGALSLALMHNFLYGGATLSGNLRELRRLGHYLVFHEDCGALALGAMLVRGRLVNPAASGYGVLGGLGIGAPPVLRRRIVEWARNLSVDYFDVPRAIRVVSEVEQIAGQHNAVEAVVSHRDGYSFVAGPQLATRTNGLLAFAFDPWVARRKAREIGVSAIDQAAAALLSQVFTAEALLQLGGSDLRVTVHR